MKINAVFFDIDGTFFDHVSGMVLPETLTAVKKLRENGYKVCLCSGRAKEMAEQLGVLQMTAWDGLCRRCRSKCLQRTYGADQRACLYQRTDGTYI